ncbi:MAG: hypothetical protein ABH803_01785 [Candidatus Micrarchaeota archaeon]
MYLDAPAFKPVVTPELALGIIKKAVEERGWKTYELTDVKLVYTPYWVFSFDVIGGQNTQTGKIALNAFSGELNELVPMMFERPLKKSKQTEEGVESEIETTSISIGEARQIASSKVAASTGLTPDQVKTSAFTKIYIASYKIWVTVAGNDAKIEVDAALGIPTGIEQLPAREKGWSEAASSTISKMSKPSGWMELIGKTFSSLIGGAAKGDKKSRNILLIAVVVILAGLLFITQSGLTNTVKVECKPLDNYLSAKPFLGLGTRKLVPAISGDKLFIEATCEFTNNGKDEAAKTAQLYIKSEGIIVGSNSSFVTALPPSTFPAVKQVIITWEGDPYAQYEFSFEQI